MVALEDLNDGMFSLLHLFVLITASIAVIFLMGTLKHRTLTSFTGLLGVVVCTSAALLNPNRRSLELYLVARRGHSVSEQLKGLFVDVFGGENVDSFASYIFCSVAHTGDGRTFLGCFKVWFEVTFGLQGRPFAAPSLNELQTRWAAEPLWDLYALAGASVAVFLLWQCCNKAFMQRHFTVSWKGISAWRVHTLLTASFSHESSLHLVRNLVAMFSVGPSLQAALGRERLVELYLLGGMCASLSSVLLHARNTESLGASGAYFALEAALVCLQPDLPVHVLGFEMTASQLLVLLIALDAFHFLQGAPIDYVAHAGGAACGWLFCRHLQSGGLSGVEMLFGWRLARLPQRVASRYWIG